MGETVYILGTGTIGMSLAVHLSNSGKKVVAAKTSTDEFDRQMVQVTIHDGKGRTFKAPVEMVSLARIRKIVGTIVISTKSYANAAVASKLTKMEIIAPLVIMQNGIGIENPYIEQGNQNLYRCVLYATGQRSKDGIITFRAIKASPIGIVRGNQEELEMVVNRLSSKEFPFCIHSGIQLEIWKKAIVNSVFNSICPLLEIDNGVFIRDERVASLAREVVDECISLTANMGLSSITAEGIMKQIFSISKRSDGQLISTLQDMKNGRETEIDSLNLEIARIAENMVPPVELNITETLGKLIKLKSTLGRGQQVLHDNSGT